MDAQFIQHCLANLHTLSQQEQIEIWALLDEIEKAELRETCSQDFMAFVKHVWPNFVEGSHHKVMANTFGMVCDGNLKRVAVNLGPRHTKSEFTSYLLPAWFLGKYPDKKIIQCSNTAELAVGFGRKVRNLIDSAAYKEIFPDVSLSVDSKSAGRWATNRGGEYFAIGVGGTVTGKGGDIVIIDDPHSEQEAALAVGNPGVFDHVYEWYTSGPRQRLQPGGRILVVMTRWSKRDLTGRILKSSVEKTGVDEWKLIELPAILDENLPTERSLWPEFWPIDQLKALRSELPVTKWQAQYQQNPTSETGALIKRDWWMDWVDDEGTEKKPPKCKSIIMAGDTAFSKSNRADLSAFVTFGVFEREGPGGKTVDNLILIDAWTARLEFPELKERVKAEIKSKKPDTIIIEAKASGAPLIQELRMSGIPVQDFTPVRGTMAAPNDKIARTNAVTDILASRMVWACKDHRYAQEVIDQCAEFPNGEHDDLVDCVVMALTRFRVGGYLSLPSDDQEEPQRPRAVGYY